MKSESRLRYLIKHYAIILAVTIFILVPGILIQFLFFGLFLVDAVGEKARLTSNIMEYILLTIDFILITIFSYIYDKKYHTNFILTLSIVILTLVTLWGIDVNRNKTNREEKLKINSILSQKITKKDIPFIYTKNS